MQLFDDFCGSLNIRQPSVSTTVCIRLLCAILYI